MIYARIAAVTYVAWGILHLGAAYGVYQLGTTLDDGVLQGRIFQGAWDLTSFALFGAVVGIVYIWRNSRLGYWLNAVVVSAGDIGFIVTLLAPGTVPLVPGALGPVLWIIALALSTNALRSAPLSQHQPK
ncbi:hypothetical protein DSM110093_01726 [Sulfitobacter sp. DSM 110093]|uniref:hypothetical protein n=1 Tax=Sulfitobacter sp. DSM 110093 TaxID=2883127 RepID=UPI001FABEBEF|nr:hypothetical protein [Sulfitobacter sp. DSM 110093]UOA31945.1 hypothetical protein DSM110093_01726 [Sulfitobacter sp. DSM 110093]